ncbi:MAG: F-box protein 11 [Candidatus Electronema aureum]|uniref:F-box protein 11 n=1 Tax=Candidatus Electronema aureum TaxID=2005002 RepID=A0A521G027_9BACT|nr:MAG: F-box protein 11 [Candidatus Electronema aureum]
MSYVNLDDQHENGLITQFREHLSRAVRMQTGEAFEIFQDRKDIAWGQQWQERINGSLDATTFLLPIITPAFFRSDACREELERFLRREEELQRGDLILPVYYVSCPVLSDKAKRERDKLAQVIAARQYADWRELRFEEFASSQCRKAFAKLAEQLMEALERSEAESARAESMRKADAAKAATQPESSKKGSKEPANSSNTFQSSDGGQSIGQGKGAIGTQINNYYAPPPQDAKSKPAPVIKTEPPVLIVDEDSPSYLCHSTITGALKAAEPGTRIIVKPGLYEEGIVIDKPVEIVGDGDRNKIVIQANGEDAVLFRANNGKVSNLTIKQTGKGNQCAVNISCGRLDIEDCDISSQGYACVLIHSGANPCLRRNRIHNGNGIGVIVTLKGKGIIEHNEIFANTQVGVRIREGGSPTLRHNRITQHGKVGIDVSQAGGGIFADNDLRGNAKGAWHIETGCEARVQRRGNIE